MHINVAIVLQVGADGSLGFAYCDANGKDVTEEGDYPKIETQPEAVTGLSLDKKTLTVKEGKTRKLTAKFSPVNATNKTLIWESSDESVATVTPEETGTNAKIQGVSAAV